LSKRLIVLLAAVLALAAIAGCGSSDSDTGTASESTSASEDSDAPALSKAEFAEQGNKVCTDSQEEVESRIADFFADVDGEPTEEDQERVVAEVVAPAFQEIVDGLGELGAPAGEEDALAELLEELEAGLSSIEDDPVAAVEDSDLFAEANDKAEALGLNKCAEN
jgi:hypothetical protein